MKWALGAALTVFILVVFGKGAAIAVAFLFLLAIMGDRAGKARYGDNYRFDDGVDR